MSRTRELLVRTGVVKIFIQIPGIDSVEIYVGKKPLTNSKGEEVGAMNSDTFVEFSGSDGDVYSYDTFTLYFTNKNGDKLVEEQRSVRYRRNLPKATVVLEQLARGPLEKDHYPTIPENSEVLSLTKANGICYVDYNSVFQDYALNVSEQIPIYSVVNTLIAATDVDKVEISIEGNKEVTFGQNMQLYKFYEWNDSLLASAKAKRTELILTEYLYKRENMYDKTAIMFSVFSYGARFKYYEFYGDSSSGWESPSCNGTGLDRSTSWLCDLRGGGAV